MTIKPIATVALEQTAESLDSAPDQDDTVDALEILGTDDSSAEEQASDLETSPDEDLRGTVTSSPEPGSEQALNSLLVAYFTYLPTPSDEQVHALAEACGLSFQELEKVAYALLGDLIQEEEAEGEMVVPPVGTDDEDFEYVTSSVADDEDDDEIIPTDL